MEGSTIQRSMALARGRLARIEQAEGRTIQVHGGALWITQEGDRRDYFVGAGERLRLARPGLALAHALRTTTFTLTEPL